MYGNYYGSSSMLQWILILIPMAIGLWAQFNVQSTFSRYSQVPTQRGLTGAQAARSILDANGLQNVAIEHIEGQLTDHFDPQAGVIRLSDSVYAQPSIAAVGVAAHEAGHAVQHATGYGPIKLRNAIIPLTQLGSNLAVPIIIAGLVLQMLNLVYIGIGLFILVVIFQLITLPVEFDASRRALAILGNGYLGQEETHGVQKVLGAAALTYVAALASAVGTLLRFLLMAMGMRRRD